MLNGYKHAQQIKNCSSACPHYGEAETIEHVLLVRPAHDREREEMLQGINMAQPTLKDLPTLRPRPNH